MLLWLMNLGFAGGGEAPPAQDDEPIRVTRGPRLSFVEGVSMTERMRDQHIRGVGQ